MVLVLAIIAAVLFALHMILWYAVPSYRNNMLLGLGGLAISAAVIVKEVGVG